MVTHICLVSSNEDAKNIFRNTRAGLIPKEIRNANNTCANFSMTCFDPQKEVGDLAAYLIARVDKTIAVVILWDEDIGDIPSHYLTACFVAKVNFPKYPKINYKNYFCGKLSKIIKTFSKFLEIINDGSNEQVMLLPFRNFKAVQLENLRAVCASYDSEPEFINKVNSLVIELKKRRRQHRKSTYPNSYYFDDEDKMFSYGLEKHATLATGNPHLLSCVLMGNFRFGKRIPTDRHFNLSKECGKGTKISGSFFGCHDNEVISNDQTHINIFSNDYMV